MHTNKLLYFSLDKEARTLFHQYVEKIRAVYKHSFQLVDKKSELCEYGHASDLMVILDYIDQHEVLDHFFVIIDYLSLYNNDNKSNETFDSTQRASDIIRRALLKYPEILFLFDESRASSEGYDFFDFLFNGSSMPTKLINGNERYNQVFLQKELHQFNIKNSDPLSFISRGKDNLFDGSNLRYFVKKYLYKDLCIDRENFRFIQESRANHLAFCIEKESSQNKFNSYALYANGFRVTQILSAEELKYLNENFSSTPPEIIVRDFDLQFNDIDTSNKTETYKTGDTCFPINEIDKIRGAKFFDEESFCNESTPEDSKVHVNGSLVGKWKIIKENNPYWSNLKDIQTYYVTNSEENINIVHSPKESVLIDGVKCLSLHGIIKPVSGIYTFFSQFYMVKERVNDIRKTEIEAQEQETYHICIKRKNHDHSKPLDVYDLAKSMIERAEKCYTDEKYVNSAVIASEAIEVMNGFHTSLMLKAYSTKSRAENALAIDILGGSEFKLRDDVSKRIAIIKKDVKRILNSDYEQSKNVLSQIFSDCRNYCKEKEHFDSEDVFLAAMAELNEGCQLSLDKGLKSCTDSLISLIKKHKEFIKDKFDNFIKKVNSYGPENETGGRNEKAGDEKE